MRASMHTHTGVPYFFKILAPRFLDLFKILATGHMVSELKDLSMKIRKIDDSFQNRRTWVEGRDLVSIIVPTRNEVSYLPFLLSSLKVAKYKPIEVIVVDYSSTDGTIEIAQNFGAKVIPVSRKGVGYASHIGVLESRGEIVIRTDADAIFPPDTIFDTVKVFHRNKRVELYHMGHLYRDGAPLLNLVAHLYDKYWREKWKVAGHFMAFRRDIYEDVGGFDCNKIVGEDWDFGKKASKKFLIAYHPNDVILVSSRRISETGFLNYMLGRRRRQQFNLGS